MERSRLLNVLLVLLIIIAALYLAQMFWQLVSGYADLLLLFMLGWLVSFVLDPAVTYLSVHPVPHQLKSTLEQGMGEKRSRAFLQFRFSRGVAVVIVYIGLMILIILFAALLLPTLFVQLSQLASHLPEYTLQVPVFSTWVQTQLQGVGVRVNIEDAVKASLGGLQSFATGAVQNALGIFTGMLNFFANLFLVLILGFIFTLDGPRLRQVIVVNLVPQQYHDETRFFVRSVNRTFGGFIRGQLIQALLVMFGTVLAMSALGLNFVLIASLFAGLFMLIPLVGPFLALIPPLLVVGFQAPELAPWLFVALLIYQLVISNILMPRLMSDALGLHPLLVFAAILASVKIAGFWGAFFGIPVAGVIWAMAKYFFERWQKDQVANGDSESME